MKNENGLKNGTTYRVIHGELCKIDPGEPPMPKEPLEERIEALEQEVRELREELSRRTLPNFTFYPPLPYYPNSPPDRWPPS